MTRLFIGWVVLVPIVSIGVYLLTIRQGAEWDHSVDLEMFIAYGVAAVFLLLIEVVSKLFGRRPE